MCIRDSVYFDLFSGMKSSVHCTWSAAAHGYSYAILVHSSSTFTPSVGKAIVASPSYVPIPAKLVAKITSGIFLELADLLAENLRAQESEPHTYLDGTFVVSAVRKRAVEITNILTWDPIFTIYVGFFAMHIQIVGRI